MGRVRQHEPPLELQLLAASQVYRSVLSVDHGTKILFLKQSPSAVKAVVEGKKQVPEMNRDDKSNILNRFLTTV